MFVTIAALVIGVELPFAGSDGADGLHAREGVELAVADWHAHHRGPQVRTIIRDSARHIANPHEDEGTDPVDEPQRGAAIVRAFARDPAVAGIVGALHDDVVRAEAVALRGAGLALVSGGAARGWRGTVFACTAPAPARAGFVRRFRARYLEAPAPEAVRFYAATQILLQALERARGSRTGALRSLRATCVAGTCRPPGLPAT